MQKFKVEWVLCFCFNCGCFIWSCFLLMAVNDNGVGKWTCGHELYPCRHWGVLLSGLFVRKARHLPIYVWHVHTLISTLCLILYFCWPHFYCGSRFILNFFFSLHFPLPVVRSLTHCAQVSSVCSAHLSSGLSYLPSTLAAQVFFPCEFSGLLPALPPFYATTHGTSGSGAL